MRARTEQMCRSRAVQHVAGAFLLPLPKCQSVASLAPLLRHVDSWLKAWSKLARNTMQRVRCDNMFTESLLRIEAVPASLHEVQGLYFYCLLFCKT